MKGISILLASQLCSGELHADESDYGKELNNIVIDSRAVEPGDLFVAYRGERVDGNDYIGAAFDKGAACCLANLVPEGETRPVIVTDDVQAAIEKIAAYYRSTLNIPIVGITGSVGKTSAKEMISAVLSRHYPILKTDKNLNNQIGVPMTLSRIGTEHRAAVVEMGISGFGEMSELAAMVRPTVGVFTVIGHAHLEFLNDLDGVMRAKTEMLGFMDDDAAVIVNGDDEHLNSIVCRQRVIRVGLGEHNDIRAENIEARTLGTDFDLIYGDRRIHASVPAFGKHIVYAALEAAAVGFELGLDEREVVEGLASYQVVGRRAAVVDTCCLTLVDDCYNSNPDSAKCGVDSLTSLPGRKVCILGDMLELGDGAAEMHYDLGRYCAQKGIDLVLTVGELSKEICRGAGDRGVHFESVQALIAQLPELLRAGDAVLVKASRAMKFEDISEAIKRLG